MKATTIHFGVMCPIEDDQQELYWPLLSNGLAQSGRRQRGATPRIEALRYAIQMLGKGYGDVVIVDLAKDGKAYAPTEFAQFYTDTRK